MSIADTLGGYERALIDGLFFDSRTNTSTALVKQHYRKTGFDPADVIRAGLKARMAAVLPPGRMPWTVPLLATLLYCGGAALLAREWFAGRFVSNAAPLFVLGVLPLLLLARREGLRFHANVQWGPEKALSSLLPAVPAIVVAALYLWRWADSGVIPASDGLAAGVVMIGLSVLFAGAGAMKSTQHRAALAFRKILASGREFFIAELAKPRPALRDEWFPWILAFGLGKQMDDWSALRASSQSTTGSIGRSRSSTSFGSGESASSSGTWTGFAGGLAWGAAAVAPRGRRRRPVSPHRLRRRARAVRAGDRAARVAAAAADRRAAAVVAAGNYRVLALRRGAIPDLKAALRTLGALAAFVNGGASKFLDETFHDPAHSRVFPGQRR